MEILKVLVGSHAHGLATPESDVDYRGVYVDSTRSLLSCYATKPKGTHWVEGENEDATAYELGHFLNLAVHCNPSILEVFMAPVVSATDTGNHLRELFQYVWNARDVANAFTGYSHNQRTKFLNNKDGRKWKFAVAYTRVLLQAVELLSTGEFSLKVPTTPIKGPYFRVANWAQYLADVRKGAVSTGEIIDISERLRTTVNDWADNGPYTGNEPDLDAVDEFLFKVRKENW
jgi:hypothetical protein